jgi:hypothetical protein
LDAVSTPNLESITRCLTLIYKIPEKTATLKIGHPERHIAIVLFAILYYKNTKRTMRSEKPTKTALKTSQEPWLQQSNF